MQINRLKRRQFKLVASVNRPGGNLTGASRAQQQQPARLSSEGRTLLFGAA
jgi:hypothetical protein